jgi:hypothetical protein
MFKASHHVLHKILISSSTPEMTTGGFNRISIKDIVTRIVDNHFFAFTASIVFDVLGSATVSSLIHQPPPYQ